MKFKYIPDDMLPWERILVVLSAASYILIGPFLVYLKKISLGKIIVSILLLGLYIYVRRNSLFARRDKKDISKSQTASRSART